MFAHRGAMLGPRRWFWSYVVFMTSPSFPNFAWKSSPQWPARILPGRGAPPMHGWRLPPVACEVPENIAQGVQVRPSRAMLGLWQTSQPDFVSKTLLLPGTGITKMPLNRSMLAYLGAMLGLCWPIWGLCWGHVRPSWRYVGAMLGPYSRILALCWGFVGPPGVILD